jgi:hypothetical protein
MKRSNFLSGLMAAPLALKARFLTLFHNRPVEPCGAPILEWYAQQPVHNQPRNQSLTRRQREVIQLLAEGKSMKEAAGGLNLNLVPRTAGLTCRTARKHIFYCSLPHGHKGPHMLVNRQLQLSRLSFGSIPRA